MGGRNNRNRQQNQGDDDNERPPVRIRLQVGFTPPRAAPSVVATNINTRLAQLAVDHSLGQPQVSVEGGTVVLRGVAESESQRRVLERLIMLEPGVLSVRNEMVLAGATTEEPLPQPVTQ
jgi:osmotically-inducible protein OsmY